MMGSPLTYIVGLLVLIVLVPASKQLEHQDALDITDPRISSNNLPCPDPGVVEPCVCIVVSETIMDMNCSDVANEDDLKRVFSQSLPFNNFRRLIIEHNGNIKAIRAGDLGEATFTEFLIAYNKNMSIVYDKALIKSASTATRMDMYSNSLTSFPFDEIPLYTSLTRLNLAFNDFKELPKIESETLTYLGMYYQELNIIPVHGLQHTPKLNYVDFRHTNLADVIPDTYTGLPLLRYVYLDGNQFTELKANSFELHGTLNILRLPQNLIADVAVGFASGLNNLIDLNHNQLTELKEEVFRPVFENVTDFHVIGNPLLCGCDIAWLILNQDFMWKLDGEEMCADGERLVDLDPAIFEQCPQQ